MDSACFRADPRRLHQNDTRLHPGIVEDWREGVTTPETSSSSHNRDAAKHRIRPSHGEVMVNACTNMKRGMLREFGINPSRHLIIMLQTFPGALRLPGSRFSNAYAVVYWYCLLRHPVHAA
jgi:hypothetical protein